MQKIDEIFGKVIPLAMNDVDTDLIIPAQYLTSVSKQGYGENLFRRLKQSSADFVFNKAEFKDASILVTQDNFGCGSSREHAVWALTQAGIKVVIAESFADIFFNNSAKNGLVLIQQPKDVIQKMLVQAESAEYHMTINLHEQSITANDEVWEFELDPFHRYCFLNGLDELDYVISYQSDIDEFIKQQKQTLNWQLKA